MCHNINMSICAEMMGGYVKLTIQYVPFLDLIILTIQYTAVYSVSWGTTLSNGKSGNIEVIYFRTILHIILHTNPSPLSARLGPLVLLGAWGYIYVFSYWYGSFR